MTPNCWTLHGTRGRSVRDASDGAAAQRARNIEPACSSVVDRTEANDIAGRSFLVLTSRSPGGVVGGIAPSRAAAAVRAGHVPDFPSIGYLSGEPACRTHFQRELFANTDYEIVRCSSKNGVFYAAVRTTSTGEVWALVVLMHRARGEYNFGYKPSTKAWGLWSRTPRLRCSTP